MNITSHTLGRLLSEALLLATTLLISCSDDPKPVNEEEVITTITVTLTPATGNVVTLTWDDTDLDRMVDENEVITSEVLSADQVYTAAIQMLNKSADPDINITEEITEEAEDHIFCFTVAGANLVVTNRNEDNNGLPVGLTSTWTTTTASTGTVNITLRHQPGKKAGDCPGGGDTDASITFAIEIVS